MIAASEPFARPGIVKAATTAAEERTAEKRKAAG
jgi:hypothetical protein